MSVRRKLSSTEWEVDEKKLRQRIQAGRTKLKDVEVPDAIQESAAALCLALKTDGLRGQLTLIRAARALAAFEKQKTVSPLPTSSAWPLPSLRHRLAPEPAGGDWFCGAHRTRHTRRAGAMNSKGLADATWVAGLLGPVWPKARWCPDRARCC